MMKQTFHFGNIQKRILFITLSCILSMCLIVSSASYYMFHEYLQQNMIHSTETNLQLLSDTINNSISDIYRMVLFCQTNTNITSYIKSNSNTNSGTKIKINAYNRMTEEYNNNPSKAYMPRVAIITSDHFMQICDAAYSTTVNLAKEVPELPYFDILLADNSYDFSTGLIADPFRKNRTVIPIIRPVTYEFNSIQAGYLFMEISGDLFTYPLSKYAHAEDSNIYLTMGKHNYIFQDNIFTEIDSSGEVIDDLSNTALLPDTSIVRIHEDDKDTHIVVTIPLNLAGCYLSQNISQREFHTQQQIFQGILGGILIGILAIGFFLICIMNRMIHNPVAMLRSKIQKISDGDFSRELSIEWNHELGDIGRGINNLAESVTQLMDRRLEDEKQKKDLEYQMLLNQINPHFIYNTLNSIKWMASIQCADGISEMTAALARLLRTISKGSQLLIPIRDELSFSEDYFTIQNYRYGGTISLHIHIMDEDIYDCQIIKFTLQPLLENAIFHGIEPKGGTGLITIKAAFCNSDIPGSEHNIRIDITDDGVGISNEKAEQLLSQEKNSNANFFKEIGISNVQKRLQYEFGEQYGISVRSVAGEFTTMSILIPARRISQEVSENV